jgi:hypothetical protein
MAPAAPSIPLPLRAISSAGKTGGRPPVSARNRFIPVKEPAVDGRFGSVLQLPARVHRGACRHRARSGRPHGPRRAIPGAGTTGADRRFGFVLPGMPGPWPTDTMSFWKDDVIGFALDHETRRQMEEQAAWIAREPTNPRPYYHLAQFCRINGRTTDALGLLLEAVRLDAGFADAHVSLSEIYAIQADYDAARRHAHAAAENGNRQAEELLKRYGL